MVNGSNLPLCQTCSSCIMTIDSSKHMLPMQWELVEDGGDADAVGIECGTSF
jgi:hypothetical protein